MADGKIATLNMADFKIPCIRDIPRLKTVILESPKLATLKKKIQKSIASLTGLKPEAVGVKAKTAEGLGPEGKGEAVQAHAVVSLRRKI